MRYPVCCSAQKTYKPVKTISAKGQLISKGIFCILNSSKKWTKKFDLTTMIPQFDFFSFVFWKKVKTPKRHFEINWPLSRQQVLRAYCPKLYIVHQIRDIFPLPFCADQISAKRILWTGKFQSRQPSQCSFLYSRHVHVFTKQF